MVEIRLPNVPRCSGVRTDTGTIVSSGSLGSSPRSASQSRSAPAQIVMTTSLTVQPAAFLTALTSASGSDPNATRRCGVIDPWKRVRGAVRVAPCRIPPSRRRGESRASRRLIAAVVPMPGTCRSIATLSRCGSVRGTAATARTGCRGSPATPRASIPSSPGVRTSPPLSPAGGTSRPVGAVSSRTLKTSAPDIPSTAAWCILVSSATRPSRSPWMTYSSHSGRARSSGRATIRATCSASCWSSPGAGSASSRTWNSRSNASSSTQYG